MASTEGSPRDVSPAVIYTTVAVTSGSALLFELFQTRILSFIFWNHIVYLAISIALLGFGVSGTVVSWITRKPIANLARTIARLCACLSLSFILAVLAIAVLFPRCLRESSPESKLTFCYLVSIPPFIFAGSILALLFSYGREPMGRFYGTDLIAASVGCVLFFLLLPSLGAIPCIMLLALITGVAALVWAWRERGSARIWLGLLILTAAHFFTLGLVAPNRFDFLPENYKEMTLALAQGGAIERTEWTTLSRIDVLTSTPRTKGILFGYHEHPPYSYKMITQDASAHTRLLGSAAIADIDEKIRSGNPLSRSAASEGISWPTMIPYSILNRPDVAIIGTGGGIDVANALANNAHSVLAIELNPFTYQLTRNIYSRWNGGLLHDSRVTAVNDEGRSAIRRSSKEFDFIAVIAIDTFAALNSGAYVLSENYLYTVDAFRDYFNHLKPGGILSLFRWNSFPPKETLRLVVLAAQAWREQGVSKIDDRVLVVGNSGWASTIFKNGAFTTAELGKLAVQIQKTHQVVLFWPKVYPIGKQEAFEQLYYRSLNDPTMVASARYFNRLVSAYEAGTEAHFFNTYPFKVTPTTDDSPFFFESSPIFKLGSWNESFTVLHGTGVQTTLISIVVLSTLVMLGAIVVPLRILHAQGLQVPNAGSYMVYFAGLGFGFMILEISLMQKSVLVLGNPMYSIPILLAGILVSAGVGSVISARWKASFKNKIAASGVLLVAATLMAATSLTGGANLILPLSPPRHSFRGPRCARGHLPRHFLPGRIAALARSGS